MLGFLGVGTYAFAPILFAQGAVLAGGIANRIFYQGQHLLSFKLTCRLCRLLSSSNSRAALHHT
jgi:hypothetical protein